MRVSYNHYGSYFIFVTHDQRLFGRLLRQNSSIRFYATVTWHDQFHFRKHAVRTVTI